MKRSLIFIVILVFCLVSGSLLIRQQNKFIESTVGGRPIQIKPSFKSGLSNDKSKLQMPADVGIETIAMTAATYFPKTGEVSRLAENPPFQFIGNDAEGRVEDKQGKVLIESGNEIRILGIVAGPDRQRVLVHGGSAINYALKPSTGEKLKLPEKPPGVKVFGFGEWYWIGEHSLLGVSGVQKDFHEGPHENCANDNNVVQTKFYTFDLLTEQLCEVAMPDTVSQPVVNVLDVTSDGHIHLLNNVPQEGVEQDLGWFKIDAGK
jgi:hypothetical protein